VDAAGLSTIEVVVRLVAGALCGAVIGFDREVEGKDAGVRTHALLALGAALFGALSVGAFGDFVTTRADTNVQVDVTRIASYVAAGIGFLGGGAILKRGDRVQGLTTAASLWVAAAAGLAAGLAFWAGAAAATLLALGALLAERPLAVLVARFGRRRPRPRRLILRLADRADERAVLAAVVDTVAAQLRSIGVEPAGPDADAYVMVQLRDDTSARAVQQYVETFATRPDVRHVARE
jgi:putative Mg2+ transporter-C (MgtC) family protein